MDNADCFSLRLRLQLIVGYSQAADPLPYWTVRNSWGESWGLGGIANLGGYARVQMTFDSVRTEHALVLSPAHRCPAGIPQPACSSIRALHFHPLLRLQVGACGMYRYPIVPLRTRKAGRLAPPPRPPPLKAVPCAAQLPARIPQLPKGAHNSTCQLLGRFGREGWTWLRSLLAAQSPIFTMHAH